MEFTDILRSVSKFVCLFKFLLQIRDF